jgi:hypothetical protein
MASIMKSLFNTSVGLWAGAGLFFSSVVLPTLFLRMDTTAAGSTASLLFPGYYVFGLVAGSASVVASAYFARAAGGAWYGVLLALVIAIGCQGYASGEVRPRMSELRGTPDGAEEFHRLHRLSVRLNGIVLFVTLGVAVASGLLPHRR